jgi:hypothetical protein
MEAQYYVPKISEFHFGFEYEIIVTHIHNGEKQDNLYLKGFMTIDTELKQISSQIESKILRVKYLDEQDILELGWIKKKEEWYEIENKDKDAEITKYRLLFSLYELTENNYRTELFVDIKLGDIEIIVLPLGIRNIKNKSELKQIMQMLKIIE